MVHEDATKKAKEVLKDGGTKPVGVLVMVVVLVGNIFNVIIIIIRKHQL